jgi:hypothetical protein
LQHIFLVRDTPKLGAPREFDDWKTFVSIQWHLHLPTTLVKSCQTISVNGCPHPSLLVTNEPCGQLVLTGIYIPIKVFSTSEFPAIGS